MPTRRSTCRASSRTARSTTRRFWRPATRFRLDDAGDEWDSIALNYTSGTTGDPKGVLYHHRGAALLAMGNVIHAEMARGSVYLWTLPMFHCNGWCFPWTLSVIAGTHVCLRYVRAKAMYDAIADHGVTHLCGAPIVMATLLNAPDDEKRDFPQRVRFNTAAAPPPESVLAGMDEAGFDVTHLYGLTETYGPAVVNEWKDEWSALDAAERAQKKARQGVRYATLESLAVLNPETLAPVPADGQTIGEVMFRGNVVMKGYHKNPAATEKALGDGWFRSGDLGVMHPDGYIQLKDRSKDIIISGGENISSIEVEDALYKHPAVAIAAVVAKPDEKWGETPCAFVELRPGASATSRGADRLVPRAHGALQGAALRWCSARCPRPPRARSRNSRCASAPGRCDAPPAAAARCLAGAGVLGCSQRTAESDDERRHRFRRIPRRRHGRFDGADARKRRALRQGLRRVRRRFTRGRGDSDSPSAPKWTTRITSWFILGMAVLVVVARCAAGAVEVSSGQARRRGLSRRRPGREWERAPMSIPQEGGGPIESRDDLVTFLSKGCKPKTSGASAPSTRSSATASPTTSRCPMRAPAPSAPCWRGCATISAGSRCWKATR
jgi:urease gamma subunit